MYAIGSILKELREEKDIALQTVRDASGIDMAQLSKIENGHRLPTAEQIKSLSEIYGCDIKQLMIQRESDKILNNIEYPDLAAESLKAAENKIRYGERYLSLFQEYIYPNPIELKSRRYIGNKAKLAEWIMDKITANAPDAHTFCDLFAGTGVISDCAMTKYSGIIINDLLYSNNVIYKAFFEKGDWNKEKLYDIISTYNSLDAELLTDNYFSANFGGKFYEYNISKIIGYIRQDIEDIRPELTEKEYNILLATLIYNIDKLANTVGHFDAYIKKDIKYRPLRLRLIDARSYDNVEIYREDANKLSRKIESDVVYIDPPYNSRQYCRFYHLYETLIKWDMPQLYGVALKPAPENMSSYCTSKALTAFEDLVSNLRTKYIAVSYNNTYNSKSNSSENKIRLTDLKRILEMCGDTEVYEHSHSFFNTGKTEFENHKELLFITKVDDEKRNKSFSSLLRWR